MLTKITLIVLTIIFLQILPESTNAQNANFNLKIPSGYGIPVKFVSGPPHAEGLVETILVNAITIFFAVGGIGVVVYFIWGAVDWVLSGGDKEKVASARKKMTHAIIGLLLLSLSFVIINLVGQIAGFNPLGSLQLRNLGNDPDRFGSPIAPN